MLSEDQFKDIETPSVPANNTLPSPQQIAAYANALIVQADYYQLEGTRATVCQLILESGFVVVGESHTYSQERYDVEVGKQWALKDAKEKLFTHVVFAVQEGYIPISDFPDVSEVD